MPTNYTIKEAVEKISLWLARNKKVILTPKEKMTIHGHILPLLVKKGGPMEEKKPEGADQVQHEEKTDQAEAKEEAAKEEKKTEESGDSSEPAEKV